MNILLFLWVAQAQTGAGIESSALQRIQASEQRSKHAELLEHLNRKLTQVEAAEKKLGVLQVQKNFLRGLQERLDREQTGLGKMFGSLTERAVADFKERIRTIYTESGARSALRALRNAERRYTQVVDQLAATVRDLRTADVTARLERTLAEAGGVSKMVRGALQEQARRVNEWSILRWLFPFHFTVELWGGFGNETGPWYLQILLTPVALVVDVALLPVQIIVIAGLVIADWVG